MKFEGISEEEVTKLQDKLIQREKEENIATATLRSEILFQLNISIDTLPLKCQQLLRQCALSLAALDVELDPIAISLRQTKEVSEMLDKEYEVLELRQENQRLQRQIDRNNKFIQDLKRELQESKDSLANQNPNPGNIQEHIRQMKQKLASYEDICEKAKAKFLKLGVPDAVLPASLQQLISRLEALQLEEQTLKQRADDITLARQARGALAALARGRL